MKLRKNETEITEKMKAVGYCDYRIEECDVRSHLFEEFELNSYDIEILYDYTQYCWKWKCKVFENEK